MFTSDPNPTALSDVYRLFTTIVYLAIQVACFGAIFDCITNMIGRLFNLYIVDLYSDVNVTFYVFMFSSCSVKCSVKMMFWYFITCF